MEGFQMGALQPVDQKTVDFMGTELLAVKADDENIYVGVSWICEGLGMDARRQREKLQAHMTLSKGVATLPLPSRGGVQEAFVINIDFLPLWLASINPALINEVARDKLLEYQLKAKDVLAEAFLKKPKLPTSPTEIAILTLEGLKEQEGRLGTIEQRMDNYEMNAPILPQQAESLTEHVKKKVYALVNANFGGNEGVARKLFAKIGRDIKKAFSVNKRAMIAKKDFDRAIDFVRAWEPDSVTRFQLQLELTDEVIGNHNDLH